MESIYLGVIITTFREIQQVTTTDMESTYLTVIITIFREIQQAITTDLEFF